ncbi:MULTISPECIES: hypothetical protein [Arcicella]|uniref:Uncharacterized protein n=1 Tax=Arcicella aquatica TaxID=217141 RepID=A0ABU5QQM2_9BACT|nr:MULTISPECIES: hypothetical protein [Arcicella]MDR6560456.1 hypothetical protein [Arcicella sp. BE51]MDR6809938.1 hypothetical protein [Arcicella sp. BE140]MDR6821287.1 hypothetical protein [Arcicella sp. BE139]MEA5259388.1 hypothetical protein [Arcicella aquatica]
MKHIDKLPPIILIALFALLTMVSCKNVDDPFVPRVVSPVLVAIDGTAPGDFATEPTISYTKTGNVVLSARILELDKTNLLDYKKGIDSLPVANTKITITLRNTGAVVAELTTDAKGKISVEKTWLALGLSAPVSGNSIPLNWSGSYKGQSFTRLSRASVK